MLRIFEVLLIFVSVKSYSQCSPESGPPPSNQIFNTANNNGGGTLPPGSNDLNWEVAFDSINGIYAPAVVMSSTPSDYYISPWHDCAWISLNATGNQSGSHTFFYKRDFNLPCKTVCGKSYNEDGSFCLSLDLFADNSIYEIYVNGVPQSGNLGNAIPVADPYEYPGSTIGHILSVSLCHNWKAGKNSLVIEVASSPPATAMLVQASTVYDEKLSNFIDTSICNGETIRFGSQVITAAGHYSETFQTVSGCDSTVEWNVRIKQPVFSNIDTSICQGQRFLGYKTSGVYKDTFNASNGCDSIRTLNLTVVQKPEPSLEKRASICKGDTLLLNPGKFISYMWQDSSTSDHYVVRNAGFYSVTVTNSCGSANAGIAVDEKICHIYFPSAFTPNHDGKNDRFRILTDYLFEKFTLTVYNRFGQKVFESHNPNKGWDGNFNGDIQPSEETFVWHCTFRREGVTTEMSGTVVLIR